MSETATDMLATATSSMDAAASSSFMSSLAASASSALAEASSASASAAIALASATGGSAADGADTKPASYKIIGLVLAITSGAFIGSSFVFKKKGLLSMQNKPGFVAGEGHSYLKSPMWWLGMTLMVVGEICNFAAYAFAPAVLVTPMGALSVVICAILSSIFLKEKLTFFGKVGCALCILGAVIIALNGPAAENVGTIRHFQKLFLAPGYLAFGSIVIVVSLGLVFWVAPRYGKKNMLVYICICSLIGGLSVTSTTGLGASILTSIRGDNQFTYWFIYFLLVFVICTLLIEINYLNKALELFNTAMVTPTYYVIFTACTLVSDSILHQGFDAPVTDIITVVFGFLVICAGITLLQMSKIDPEDLANKVSGLDRRTTMLLKAADKAEAAHDGDVDEKHQNLDLEDPGVDSVRGFVGLAGSIHRAVSARRSIVKRRQSHMSASGRSIASRYGGYSNEAESVDENGNIIRDGKWRNRHGNRLVPHLTTHGSDDFTRHQLYDTPMPDDAMSRISHFSNQTPVSPTSHTATEGPQRLRSPTIGFESEVVEHRYPERGQKGEVVHQQHMQPPRERGKTSDGTYNTEMSELRPPSFSGTGADNASIVDAYGNRTPTTPTYHPTTKPEPIARPFASHTFPTRSGSGGSATTTSTASIQRNTNPKSLTQMLTDHFAADTKTSSSNNLPTSADEYGRMSRSTSKQRSPIANHFPFSRSQRSVDKQQDEEERMGLVGHESEMPSTSTGDDSRTTDASLRGSPEQMRDTSYDDEFDRRTNSSGYNTPVKAYEDLGDTPMRRL